MSRRRIYQDYVRDMLESAEKAILFVSGMDFNQFSRDEKTIFAVIRAIDIIGEAAKNIPPEIREGQRDIPWREISGTRDKRIHEYSGVNLSVVWRTVQDDLPILIIQLRKLLSNLE